MSERIAISRSVHVPSRTAIARSLRAPELGPRILLFSGGTALKRLCRRLKDYTHNSIHLITPFDSGGSSAKLRHSFGMLSVGDLRNRLMALADEGALGNPEIYALFSHRLASVEATDALRGQLHAMVSGTHELVAAVPEPMRRIVQVHLRHFVERMPNDFDLRAASIGNLILAGGFLANDRDIESVIFLFSKLVNVRGIVRPTVDVDLHLAAEMASGKIILGQHKLTGKETDPITEPIERLQLTTDLEELKRAGAQIDQKTRALIESTDLICYPMGSFYTSVIANLLPGGVGTAVSRRRCPKVYIPNLKGDPEQVNTTVMEEIDSLVDYVRRDAGQDVPLDQVMNLVLLHDDLSAYGREVNVEALSARGLVPVIRPIVASGGAGHDPLAVTEILLSLA